MSKLISLIPGPTELSKNVINVLNRQIEPHYGDKWLKDYENIKNKVKKIFKTKNEIFIFAGSGTIAIESSIASSLKKGDEVLICHNGYWSDRLIEICKTWKLKINILKSNFDKPINTKKLEKIIFKRKKIKIVMFVHVDTSTGIVNPITDIARITKKYNKLLLVDGIASVGGININTDKIKIDYLITSSQKCFSAPAGLGILSLSDRAIKTIRNNKNNQIGFMVSLNKLMDYQKKWELWHPHGPTTAPVSIYLALETALDNLLKEKLSNVYNRHLNIKNYIRNSLINLNLELYIKDEKSSSNTLTTFILPKKINSKKFLKDMKKDYLINLSGDLGYVNPQLIRIGHMGNQANIKYAKKIINSIKNYILLNK